MKEEYLEDLKIQIANTEQKMIRSEEMWRREREVMKREHDNLLLEVHDLTQQRGRMKAQIEDASKRHSTASLDTDFIREIHALNKVRIACIASLCECTYVCMLVCMYAHIYVCAYAHVCVCVMFCVYVHTCMCVCQCSHMFMCTCAC